jgi:DNA-binding CsgD family transcriptional regulator
LAWFRLDSKEAAAQALFVSVNTVKKHIERARAKYEAAGRPAHTQALLLIRAIQDGWLDIEEW